MSVVDKPDFTASSCPVDTTPADRVLLGHGGGGRLMHQLLERVLLPPLDNPLLATRHDGAVSTVGGARIALSTDSYVVRPLFFPGGDIGELAVHGTVNDLAMCGARPVMLGVALILEEGLPIETLARVVASIGRAAERANVPVATGDTKVVERGKADGLYVTTTGVGLVEHDLVIEPGRVRPGDAVLLSGDVGRHGMAVLSAREGLAFESGIESDSAPLAEPVLALLRAGVTVHCLRDCTRGGLASSLVEIAGGARAHVAIDETAVPVAPAVRAACEIFGLDPLYVANEGRFVAFVPEADAERALAVLREHALGRDASIIGRVHPAERGFVTVRSALGVPRVLDMLSGEQLPRIC